MDQVLCDFITSANSILGNDFTKVNNVMRWNSISSVKNFWADLPWMPDGEKLYETLMSKEELAYSVDCGNFYRIPMDKRDLNYDMYIDEGKKNISKIEADYNSHNTRRLTLKEMKELLLSIDLIKKMMFSNI